MQGLKRVRAEVMLTWGGGGACRALQQVPGCVWELQGARAPVKTLIWIPVRKRQWGVEHRGGMI